MNNQVNNSALNDDASDESNNDMREFIRSNSSESDNDSELL